MPHDLLGNAVSAMQGTTLAAVDDFIGGLLAYETRAEAVAAAAAAEPGSCLANVYAGFLWMFLESPDAPARAAPFLEAAERAAAGATRRERLNTAVLRAWWADDAGEALRLCEALGEEFPRDLVIAKTQQYFEFNRGNAPAMLRIALRMREHAADVPYVHGMAAFAYEQCHLLEEAELAARMALEMRRKEPWAQHALAHVLLTRGRIDEGARLLESFRDTWTGLNSFMLTHLWWHLALFYLSQGRAAAVLEIYDRECWGVVKSYSQDQIGAVSLLARLELAGIDVGARWSELAQHLAARTRDTVQPFLSLQYLYGLARAGRPEAAVLLESIRNCAARAGAVWRDVALPAAEALTAHARGDYEVAWRTLDPVLPRMADAGGSHAQRDLFEQIALDAALRSGRLTAAQQRLELRRAADPEGVPVNEALAVVYGALRLPALADQARLRAAVTRRRHAA